MYALPMVYVHYYALLMLLCVDLNHVDYFMLHLMYHDLLSSDSRYVVHYFDANCIVCFAL